MTTKEIKNWEWIKSVEVQYMGFLTQYLGTATDSKISKKLTTITIK